MEPSDPHSFAWDSVITAGAYVCIQGRFPFVVGPTPTGQRLAIIRLGGHCEPGETPWQCARREVAEEAGLIIDPITPPACYWCDRDTAPDQFCLWRSGPPPGNASVAPVLVVVAQAPQGRCHSVMFLAHATGLPTPHGEVRGLLLLQPHEVHQIVQQPITLRQYLRAGGQALLLDDLDHDWYLEPFLQLRGLSAILQRHPKAVE